MNIDHINVKIFARGQQVPDLAPAIPMFHRWIQDNLLDELLIDIADYTHVPAGPGVMVIGDAADYSLDLTHNRLGLLYNRKRASEGTFEDKLRDAFASALSGCALVEEDPALRGKITFDAGQVEVIINDRLLAPNTEETWRALEPDLRRFFDNVLGAGSYTLQHVGEPRERFRVLAQASRFIPVSSLTPGTVLA